MSQKEKKDLLFFFSDVKCISAAGVIPTLAVLAKNQNIDFETYICTRPLSWGGKTLPFTGHMHGESFCYLANFYRKILFVSLTDFPSFQFRREILAWGGEVVSCRKESELAEFYTDVFAYFKTPFPECAGILPDAPEVTSEIVEGQSFLTPYFYYDLYAGGELGITQSQFEKCASTLAAKGVRKAHTYCCTVKDSLIPTEAVYPDVPGADYGFVTKRIAEKYWQKASGLVFADGNTIMRWMCLFLRENRIPLYDPYAWEEFVPVVSEYAEKMHNPLILGCQNVYPHNTDRVMTEFALGKVFFDLLGVDPRHAFSIQKTHPLPQDWLKDIHAPWEEEVSDEFLKQKIEEKAVPVCFLLYAADLGHLPTLPRILDLMGQEGYRAGLAFPATWYDYAPELLEQLYIPLDQGGVFPQIEPMISSGGSVVACEAEGMIEPETLTSLLVNARKKIAGLLGEHLVPRGYYPWQDASPYYKRNTGTPQFDAVAKAGFEYYITYKDSRTPGKVLYEANGMTVFNQQIGQWFPGAGVASEVIREFENGQRFETDWIVLSFDMPFFGLSPVYVNGKALHERFAKSTMGMQTLAEAMKLVYNGGESGKLFMLKPHELYRYIKLKRTIGQGR